MGIQVGFMVEGVEKKMETAPLHGGLSKNVVTVRVGDLIHIPGVWSMIPT